MKNWNPWAPEVETCEFRPLKTAFPRIPPKLKESFVDSKHLPFLRGKLLGSGVFKKVRLKGLRAI